MDEEKNYTVTEVAELTGLTRQGVHFSIINKYKDRCKLVKAGKIQYWQIPSDIVDEYISNKNTQKEN